MGSPRNQPHKQGPAILLFGSEAASFDKQSLLELKSELQNQKWAVDTLSELPKTWESASTKIPMLCSVPGRQLLTDLQTWLREGPPEQGVGDLPNTVLAPLTVLAQLTQYRRYVERDYGDELDAQAALVSGGNITTLGFCIGLLTAFAIASSATTQDLDRYAAVSVRLAMLVGGVVDAADEAHRYGPAESFAVLWQDTEQEANLRRIIGLFPDDAYKSVWYDERRATVTISKRTAPMLLQDLREAGITAVSTGLRGRFHSTRHADIVDELVQFCDSDPSLTFADAGTLSLPTYSNDGDDELVSYGRLHKLALWSILVKECHWYYTVQALVGTRIRAGGRASFISFGPGRCIPPSLTRIVDNQVEYLVPAEKQASRQFAAEDTQSSDDEISFVGRTSYADSSDGKEDNDAADSRDIAIVGMSIKVAGADDLAEFSTILRTGESQHQEVPPERVVFGNSPWRRPEDNDGRKWYGNFINDVDAFDHRFFRKSPRESAAMDPQQRLVLQAAYQAVEQSGYFSPATSASRDKHIGVYLGTCATEYEHNAACHPAGAFTVMGLLRGSIAGRISHYFGWTGPSMTFDTACSGSAVAIHAAVQALRSGECSAALCGGVNIITNDVWFHNLAGASFLSPTGQCKPFDEGADGYCRGEGIGCVFLKPMAAALADGDQIFGTIAGTAVYQNSNDTPLFVPHTPSMSKLFCDVIRQARLEPQDISLVEAHGTGTPVGDPAEYQSIRAAIGGPIRRKPLPIGSVKGSIGHTEASSGVVSLIKVVLMMHEGFIPPQPSYSKMSRRINVSASDMIQIPTSLQPWTDDHKSAIINNYGASGSIAAMVVKQAPTQKPLMSRFDKKTFLFWIAGFDDRSIAAYCTKLSALVRSKEGDISIADLSFNVNRQSNPTLPRALLFRCSTVAGLLEQLSPAAPSMHIQVKPARPVILCFGGQTSKFIGLDRKVYENVPLIRYHLDRCNTIIQFLGHESIYPGIFTKTPVTDPVHLQTMLFALQYMSTRCWMDCGVRVDAVVGHSFGEITALCVAGVLELRDAIGLIAGRAKIIRDSWGPDHGVMIAVDGELGLVEQLIADSNRVRKGGSPASIACYNSAQSFTLAGSTLAMDSIVDTLSRCAEYASIRSKKLNVTNAFHSALVEPLLPSLRQLGMGLRFHSPKIRIERATEVPLAGSPCTPNFVAHHMRNPVFFHHAVQRLAKDFPSAIWLEAGSGSKITSMVRRIVTLDANSHFQALGLTEDRGIDSLTDATLSLWKEGLHMTFWPHHGAEAVKDYTTLLLPQYQFEKTRHWLDLKTLPPPSLNEGETRHADLSLGLWTFAGYQDAGKRHARFRINTESEQYMAFVSGHVAVQTVPICPATLEYSMVIEAFFSLKDGPAAAMGRNLHPVIRDMSNDTPLCVNAAQSAWLELQAEEDSLSHGIWTWRIVTTPAGQQPDSRNSSNFTVCVQGRLELRSSDETAEFARYERLVSYKQCNSLLQNDAQADDVLQGRNVYRSLVDVVDYGDMYRGVRRVVGRENECAGIVHDPTVKADDEEKTWLDEVPLTDSFSQVAGVWVNCMTDREPNGSDVFLATGCEKLMRRPGFARGDRLCQPGKVWHIWARHHRESQRVFLTDVFVFDAADGWLTEVMLGIRYTRIPRLSMSRLLERLTENSAPQGSTNTNKNSDHAVSTESVPAPQLPVVLDPKGYQHEAKVNTSDLSRLELSKKVKDVIASVSGAEASEIQDDSELADLGIDSLAGTELSREIESVFHYKIDTLELLFEATSFREFVAGISRAVNGQDNHTSLGPVSENTASSSSPLSRTNSFSEESGDSSVIITPTIDDSSIDERNSDAAIDSVIAKTSTLAAASNSQLSRVDILAAFAEIKRSTDQRIRANKVDNTDAVIIARSNRLCVALVVEAFEHLGCSLKKATKGQALKRIPHQPQHSRLVAWLYKFLERDARLIDAYETHFRRTDISAPRKTSDAIFEELVHMNDQWIIAHKLAYHAGKNLAAVLSGQKTGIQALFGSSEGRDLVRGLYYDLPFNRLFYEQMRDIIQLVSEKLRGDFHEPLRILEMGAGTGGTTHIIASFLASIDIPVEYTVTDLSPSMVTQARRTFGERYPFMRFAVHDIEQVPAETLRGTQHIVIASNAVHATADLTAATSNIRAALRPDGMLLLTEMTESLPFVDLVFGLLDDWWRFADDRTHAIVSAEDWEVRLRHSGFKYVDWTDGRLSENRIQKVIIALASGDSAVERPNMPELEETVVVASNDDDIVAAREQEAERYVTQYSAGFMTSAPEPWNEARNSIRRDGCESSAVVIITGATGSLGSHLVESFTIDPAVSIVVCLNRRTNSEIPAFGRQLEALSTREISLFPEDLSKLRVLAADTTQPQLGLSSDEYSWLVAHGTHILHNAWPMSASRPLRAFEPQFQSLRRLLDLAADISTHSKQGPERKHVCFQFISSIGVVGLHPTSTNRLVPEERVHMSSVLPVGYCEAKWVCERLLDETLHRYPDNFRAMVVRPGQIAGSTAQGVWNTTEHFAFLIRSAQALRAFPALKGRLQWMGVNGVARIIADLALNEEAGNPIYHIDNPVGQPWKDMVEALAKELDIPSENILPFPEWIRRVRRSPLVMETDNPALRAVDFLGRHFERMSCGGIILDTTKATLYSPTLVAHGPFPTEAACRCIQRWKRMGFLTLF